mgnify:CR=1 FL=1
MENILGVFLFIMLYFDYICNDIAGGRITFPCLGMAKWAIAEQETEREIHYIKTDTLICYGKCH